MAVLDGYGGRLETNPEVPTASPIIKGTLVSVSLTAYYVAEGMAWQVLMGHYPEITKDDIRACLEYAADECERVKRMVV